MAETKRFDRTGGPAFSRPIGQAVEGQGPWNEPSVGMTLRDWFAGQALAGFAPLYQDEMTAGDVASQCYSLADAMLAESKREVSE